MVPGLIEQGKGLSSLLSLSWDKLEGPLRYTLDPSVGMVGSIRIKRMLLFVSLRGTATFVISTLTDFEGTIG